MYTRYQVTINYIYGTLRCLDQCGHRVSSGVETSTLFSPEVKSSPLLYSLHHRTAHPRSTANTTTAYQVGYKYIWAFRDRMLS